MMKFYNQLLAKARGGPEHGQAFKDYKIMVAGIKKESWDLIQDALRDIFVEFLKVQLVGNPAVNMDPGALCTATVIYKLLRGNSSWQSWWQRRLSATPACLLR